MGRFGSRRRLRSRGRWFSRLRVAQARLDEFEIVDEHLEACRARGACLKLYTHVSEQQNHEGNVGA